MNNLRRHALAAATACLFVSQGFAAEYSLPLTDDAYIHGAYPTTKFGSSGSVNVHTYGPMYALVRFDPAAIAGQTISKATLTLYPRTILGPGNITVHPILSSWSEGTVTWALQSPSETTAAASFDVTTSMAGSRVTVDVTNVAQRWANGTLAHAGLLLKSPTVKKAYFDSKELTGGIRAALTVVTTDGPPPAPSIPEIVLDFSTIPVVIDKPGVYVLNKDWTFQRDKSEPALIQVQSQGVTIDMRGHSILEANLTIAVVNGGLSVRNGHISSDWGLGLEPPRAISARQSVVEIDNLRSDGAGFSEGCSVSIRGSSLPLVSASNSQIQIRESSIGGHRGGLRLSGGSGRILDSAISSDEDEGMTLQGSNFVVMRNEISSSYSTPLLITGNGNIISDNLFRTQACAEGLIVVNGASNVVRGSLGFSSDGTCGSGIVFRQSGNAFGGNHISAQVPFYLNGTTQVDLGGNAGF